MEKQLARWIYYEDCEYYCLECVQKRCEEIDENHEFSDDLGDDKCGYFEDYANEDYEVTCCKCGTELYSNYDLNNEE